MNVYKKFNFALVLFLIFLLGGTFIYSFIEGWRYIDSAYFTVATVTTVGYGDFVPQTDIGKIFTMIFSFVGIGMTFYFITLFGKYIYRKTFQEELAKHQEKLEQHHEKVIKNLKLETHKKPLKGNK